MVMFLLIFLVTSGGAVGFDIVTPDYDTQSFPRTSFPQSYPSCFTEEITWSIQESIDMILGVESLYSCQALCLQSSNCHQFTWYTEQAMALKLACFLYNHPTTEYPCLNCVSGPQACTCSGYFSCQILDDNLVDVINSVQNENLCQEECAQSPICTFYTYFDIVAHPFRQTCFLFSSCDEVDYSCQGCVSGPDDCTDIIYISTLHPTSPSTSTITTPTTITTFMSTTTATCANLPESQKHGDWFCPDYKEVVTCHLECHPGYVSNNGTVITCQRGEWSSAPTCVTAVALITGRWYPSPGNTVEIYGEGIHKKMPNLPDDRRVHSLELVDSVVLLCGGAYTQTSCLVFTASQQWTRHSTTTSPRWHHSSVSMLGQLHLLGGGSSPSTTEHLTASSQQWFVGWDLIEATHSACAVNIDPEVFIVTGGWDHSSSVVAYNGTSGAATRLQDLITPRSRHGCVYVMDSDNGLRGVLVAGGFSSGSTDLSEIYDLALGEWISTGKLTTRRYGVRMVVLGQDILAMGGYDGSGHYLSSVDSFNLTTKKWTATEEMMEARYYQGVTGVPPNAVGIVEN